MPPCVPQEWHTEEKEHRRKERRFWRTYIALTILTVGGAVASAVFAFGAYEATKRQAIAAETQITVAKDTANRQLRAYLYPDHGSVNPDGSVLVHVHHTGATPAYKVLIDVTTVVGPYLVGNIQLTDPASGRISPIFHREYSVITGDGVSEIIPGPGPDAMRFVNSTDTLVGDHRVYVHGVIRYLDIFQIESGGGEHRYEFCFVFHPLRDNGGSERGCEKYNKPG